MITADDLIAKFDPEQLKTILCALASKSPEEALQEADNACEGQLALINKTPGEPKETRRVRRLYAFFRFLVDDSKSPKWQALRSEKQLDRDALVVAVWKVLETPEIQKQYHSLEYHRLWLFEWFLRRYDIRRAREVVGGPKWAQNAHWFLFLAVMIIFALRRLDVFDPNETRMSLISCGIAYGIATVALARSFRRSKKLPDFLEAVATAIHSLIPRLAGAGAVGLVILASSQELLNVVIATHWRWLICLFLAGYGYLLMEMARRIHPMPHMGRLLWHGADVAFTALTHSLTLTLLAEGGLLKVLGMPPESSLCWPQSLSIVVFIFTIGLVVNLIWAEQPVTEPL